MILTFVNLFYNEALQKNIQSKLLKNKMCICADLQMLLAIEDTDYRKKSDM